MDEINKDQGINSNCALVDYRFDVTPEPIWPEKCRKGRGHRRVKKCYKDATKKLNSIPLCDEHFDRQLAFLQFQDKCNREGKKWVDEPFIYEEEKNDKKSSNNWWKSWFR
jgi:hypothetical protein